MSMLEWAESEVKIATENEDCYGCGCYGSALKAYKSLLEDEHSVMSFGITRTILKRLLDEYPLTPIEDVPEHWSKTVMEYDNVTTYQCKRMSGLFKEVNNTTNEVTYRDVNRTVFIDDLCGKTGWSSSLADKVVDELYPIKMPYYPTGQFKLYGRSFSTTAEVGCFDTVYFRDLKTPDGCVEKIRKYFKETDNGFVEISETEYVNRFNEFSKNRAIRMCEELEKQESSDTVEPLKKDDENHE